MCKELPKTGSSVPAVVLGRMEIIRYVKTVENIVSPNIMQEKELKEEFYKKMVTLDGDYPIVDPHEKSAEDIADFWLSKIRENFISKEELAGKVEGMKHKEVEYEWEADKSIGVIQMDGSVHYGIEKGKKYQRKNMLTEEEVVYNQALDDLLSSLSNNKE